MGPLALSASRACSRQDPEREFLSSDLAAFAAACQAVAAVGVPAHQLLCPTGHAHPVPVDTMGTALGLPERVAWLCPDCDHQLPADWEAARS